jgi:hypothetical protein
MKKKSVNIKRENLVKVGVKSKRFITNSVCVGNLELLFYPFFSITGRILLGKQEVTYVTSCN